MIKVLIYIFEFIKKDLTGWLTVILLLGAFIIEILNYSKRIKVVLETIKFDDGRIANYVVAINKGVRKINIIENGWKNWNGKITIDKHREINDFLMQDERKKAILVDTKLIQNKYITNYAELKNIYYIFVKDSGGKIYKKYRYFIVVSWILRIFYYFKNVIKRKLIVLLP